MAGTFMIVLDFFIVNVALPSMQSRLHASTSALEWVVAGYGLAFSTLLITAGRLGDQIGRRRLFAIGLALFVVDLGGLRPGAQPGPAGGRPGPSGGGRRPDQPDRPVHHRRDLHRARTGCGPSASTAW